MCFRLLSISFGTPEERIDGDWEGDMVEVTDSWSLQSSSVELNEYVKQK